MMQTSTLEQELKNGRTVATMTKGVSMQPLLYEGKTTAILSPISFPVRRGDTVLYKRANGELVLHRVVQAKGKDYIIRGDNCFYDEQIEENQLLGRMVQVLRGGKTIRTTDFLYRCYTAFWLGSYPLRHFADRVRRLPQILRRVLNGGIQ